MIIKAVHTECANKRTAIQLLAKEMQDNGIIYNDCYKMLNSINLDTQTRTEINKTGLVYTYQNCDKTQTAKIEKTAQRPFKYIVSISIIKNL
jgi:hypothetical protein